MPATLPVSRPIGNVIFLLILLTAICGGNGIAALFDPPTTNPRHPAIYETALGMVLCWFASIAILVCMRRPILVGILGPREMRILYSWGCGMCLLHIAVAFHLAHAWSHSAAWEHVEQRSGFGDGLYVNYLFAVVWLVDVVWAWVAFDHYLNRPRWVSWCVHGFLAFIVFNAAVVFATGFGRYIATMMFLALAILFLRVAYTPEMTAPGSGPGAV